MDEETKRIIEQAKLEKDVLSKARLLQYLRREKNIPLVQLAKILSLNPSYICHLLRLLRLPELVIDGYYSKLVSLSHLMTVSRLKNKEDMVVVYETILANNLTVAQTDNLVREKIFRIKTAGDRIDKEIKKKIEEGFKKIDNNLQTKIGQTRIQARVELKIKGNMTKTSEVLKKIAALLNS
jgi:hypothetical protein